MTFQDLNLIEPILKALSAEGYTVPTPIQQQSIPYILAGRDLQGSAQTGTGKTAAFALPIIQALYQQPRRKAGIKVLILTPTRELAIQIDESFAAYGKFAGLKHTVIFGGVSQYHQVNALQRGIDILVATPGRLIDLIGQGYIDLRQLEVFVLDEADRMLDMGFINDVKKVISFLPPKRQTLFFSATMPPPIRELAKSLLNNPARVEVAPPATTVEKIEQSLYHTNKSDKPALLLHLLEEHVIQTALVFTRTKHGADRLVKHLQKNKVKSAAIHGNKSQPARQTALNSFKTGSLRVLVATDIAARGIDIDELSHVFNYDLPEVPETYVHRIGRTGRAGKEGTAIAFCAADERGDLSAIEKLIGIKIPVIARHPYPTSANEAPPKQVPARSHRDPSRQRTYSGNTRNNYR
jgi:ATP-dependent RNA helicase RhlE